MVKVRPGTAHGGNDGERRMWKLILLAPLAGLFGCGLECNLMYAPDFLGITFDPVIT